MPTVTKTEELFKNGFATVSKNAVVGADGKPHNHLIVEKMDAVCVTLFDKKTQQLLFVQQFRTGAYYHKSETDPFLLEPVAGHIEAGQTPEEAALREVEEETGLTIDPASLKFICKGYTTPGICNEIHYHFIAEFDSSLADLESTHGIEGEEIKLILIDVKEAMNKIYTGELRSSNALIGVLLAQQIV